MNRILHFFAVGAGIYCAAAILLICWYYIQPSDQILWLGVVSFPADIIFFFLGSKDWSMVAQSVAIVSYGIVQYGVVGVLISFLSNRH